MRRALDAALRRARRPLLLLAGVVTLSTVLGVGAFAASGFYGQFGAPRTPVSALSWAERSATYLVSDCRGCHADTATGIADEPHAGLICESCHVPSIDHPGPVEGVVQMLPPAGNADCVACHAQTTARQADFAQVALSGHYPGAECLACHEPHTSIAVKPREVTHPLAHLPACSTCHAPMGIKQFPASHQVAPDEVCLACHRSRSSTP